MKPKSDFWPDRGDLWLPLIALLLLVTVALPWAISSYRSATAGTRSEESKPLAPVDRGYLMGKQDGAQGRRLTERQMDELGWTAQQRAGYRSGVEWGEYERKKN